MKHRPTHPRRTYARITSSFPEPKTHYVLLIRDIYNDLWPPFPTPGIDGRTYATLEAAKTACHAMTAAEAKQLMAKQGFTPCVRRVEVHQIDIF